MALELEETVRIRRVSSMWRRFAPWVLVVALPLSLWSHGLWAQGRMERFARLHDLRFQLVGSNHSLSFDFEGEDLRVAGTVQTSTGTVQLASTRLNAVVVGGRPDDRPSAPAHGALASGALRGETILKGPAYELRLYDRGGSWYLKGWIETDTGMRIELFPSAVGSRQAS